MKAEQKMKLLFATSNELNAFVRVNVGLFLSGHFDYSIFNLHYTHEIEITSYGELPVFMTPEEENEYLYALEDLKDDNPVIDGGF